MPNPKYAYTVGDDGISIDDQLFIIGGHDDPWAVEGSETYSEGTYYFKTDGKVYRKGADGVSPATNDFVEHFSGGGTNPDNHAGWKDLTVEFDPSKGNSRNSPQWDELSNGMYALKFDKKDEVFINFHVPHDWMPGTFAYPHVHWFCDKTMSAGDKVQWELNYVVAKGFAQGDSFLKATQKIVLTYVASGNEIPGEHIVSECNDYQVMDLQEIDSLVFMSVKLTKNDVDKADIYGVMCDLHYYSDGLLTVNKAPSFVKVS